MALSIGMTGTGSVGSHGPGWSIREDATPHIIGDSSGAVSSASLTAGRNADSIFVLDNLVSLRHTTAGTVRGRVAEATLNGIEANLAITGALEFLVAERTFPGLSVATLESAIETYMLGCDPLLRGMTYSYEGPASIVYLPAWSGNVWARLKELCAFFGLEIVVDDNVIRVRPLASVEISLPAIYPTVKPSFIRGGRQLDVVVQNPSPVTNGVVWDALVEGDAFEIRVGDRRSLTVPLSGCVTAVTGLRYSPSFERVPGRYSVRDANGVNIPEATWADAQGDATVAIGDDGTALLFTLRGPAVEIPGYPGPYLMRNARGEATLSVVGTGVLTVPVTAELATGADEELVSDEVARSINSPMATDIATVYDAAGPALDSVAGGSVELRFSYPTDQLAGIGASIGSMFTHEHARYRITNLVWGDVRTEVTAVKLVRLSEIDDVWAGAELGDFDAFWAGYTLGDLDLQPLWRDDALFKYFGEDEFFGDDEWFGRA